MVFDWQHIFKGLNERILHLLQTDKLADCHFLVGDSPPDQKTIASHKLILALASPVFERMFYGQVADKSELIVITDIQPAIFQSMLEHIYTDGVNISSIDMAFQLYYAAKKYMLSQLLEECTRFMISNLSPKNVCMAYEFAEFYDESSLKQKCLQLILSRTREVLAEPSFMDIKMSTLIFIFGQYSLNIDSELDLFNALSRLAKHKGLLRDTHMQTANERNNHNSAVPTNGGLVADKEVLLNALPSPNLEGDFNIKCSMDTKQFINDEDLLKEAVKQIRFLSMTPKEFFQGPARSKLLEKHEIVDISINMFSEINDDYPMPMGFCRERRNVFITQLRNFNLSSDDLSTRVYTGGQNSPPFPL
ncbi:BTB/POZ domain-containing protein 3-like [Calliphora vicina]|uniref:BTB/POZ domain-containing protein 3-like n=1 Tax=Calliphora vicina TaxID=7373 RepID=UPI00325BEB38